MKKISLLPLLLFYLFFNAACSTSLPLSAETNAEPVPNASAQASLMPDSAPVGTPTLSSPTQAAIPAEPHRLVVEGEIRRQWPVEASSDFDFFDMEMVLGAPDEELCDDSYTEWISDQHEEDHAAHYLQFIYAFAVRPTQVNLVFNSKPDDSFRVEIMDSSSGLSREVFDGGLEDQGTCPVRLSIPVDADIAADTAILTFTGLHSMFKLNAVELVGILPGYSDLPVLWRIEIPADPLAEPDSQFPGGLAVDAMNRLFVANGRNGIQRYDVEGNLMKDFSVPSGSNVRDVAVDDQAGNIVVTDNIYKWFITLTIDGLQVNAGGEDFGWNMPTEVAVNPINGSIYLLDETEERSRIRVYDDVTTKWIKDLPLETGGAGGHRGLAFDTQGFLYTIDQNEVGIQIIDSNNGEILNTLGYLDLRSMTPSDLAIDGAGNIYVLVSSNPDGSAVIVLDAQGNLIRRFGRITYDGTGWGEGTFFFPISIAVTADGRFVFVCENGYLTAYRLESE
jgi:DNA-binding beta-propeller fold protein YncE